MVNDTGSVPDWLFEIILAKLSDSVAYSVPAASAGREDRRPKEEVKSC